MPDNSTIITIYKLTKISVFYSSTKPNSTITSTIFQIFYYNMFLMQEKMSLNFLVIRTPTILYKNNKADKSASSP